MTLATNYTARTYTPLTGLVTLHNTVRIYGVNELSLVQANEVQQRQGSLYHYLIGIAVPSVAMFIIALIWFFSLCCTRCCCKGKCGGKNVAVGLFTTGCVVSFLGWILAVVASSVANDGLKAMFSGVTGVTDAIVSIADLGTQAGNVTGSLLTLTTAMTSSCSGNGVAFPGGSIIDSLNQANNAVGSNSSSNGLVGQSTQFKSQITKYTGDINKYIQWEAIVTLSFSAVMAFIVAVFFFSTIFRVLDRTPERCRGCATCMSKFSAGCVFVFVILFMLIIWIIVAIIYAFLLIGSDMCVPSPTANLNRLLGEVIGNGINVNGVRRVLDTPHLASFADAERASDSAAIDEAVRRVLQLGTGSYVYNASQPDPCKDASFQNSLAGMLCYYESCQGDNYLYDLAKPIGQYTTQAVDQLNAWVAQVGGTYSDPACSSDVSSFRSESSQVSVFVDGAISYLTCAKINPIYAGLLYDGFCNGLINGLVFLVVSVILALSALMLAVSTYLIFDFGKYRDGRIPEAWAVDDDPNNPPVGQPITTYGGPIVEPADPYHKGP